MIVEKTVFGHVTDGPSTTLLPETLHRVLCEQGIDDGLVVEIMATINAQKNLSFNEGYLEGRHRVQRSIGSHDVPLLS